jgi:hypothetical protein
VSKPYTVIFALDRDLPMSNAAHVCSHHVTRVLADSGDDAIEQCVKMHPHGEFILICIMRGHADMGYGSTVSV